MKFGHDCPSWHYLGAPFTIRRLIWTKTRITVGTILEVGTISAYFSFSGGVGGPKLNKVGTIGCGFEPKLNQVGTRNQHLSKTKQSGHYQGPNRTNIEQSGHYCGWIWTQTGQSGHYRSPNRAKWALSGVDVVQGWIWTHLSRGGNGRFLHTIDKNQGVK